MACSLRNRGDFCSGLIFGVITVLQYFSALIKMTTKNPSGVLGPGLAVSDLRGKNAPQNYEIRLQ